MAFDKAKTLDLATRYLQKGQVDRALREYDRILQHDPRDVRVRQKLAELLARRDRVPEAMREFQAVADAYEKSGFFPKAAAIYKQMLRSDPDSIPLHLRLGEIYHQLGMRSDAAEHFRKVAAYVEKKGSVSELLEIHRKLAVLNPEDLDARFKLAELYLRHGDPIGAAQLFREMAADLERAGQVEDLVRVYERLIQVDTENLDVYKRLASLFLARNDPRRALQRLQVCFKADPRDTETLTLLAQAFTAAGETDKALQVYEELIRLYEEAGEDELAEQALAKVEELDPERREAAVALTPASLDALEVPEDVPEDLTRALTEADVYVRYGLADRARPLARDAAARHPSSFAAHKLRARVAVAEGQVATVLDACTSMYRLAMDAGELDVARGVLALACQAAPGDADARARLKAFDEAMGAHLGLSPRAPSSAAGRPARGDALARSPVLNGPTEPASIESDPLLAAAFADLDSDWDGGSEVDVDVDAGAGYGDAYGSEPSGDPEDEDLFDLARELESELGIEPRRDAGSDDEPPDTFEFTEPSDPPDPGAPEAAGADPFALGRSYFDVGLYEEAQEAFAQAAEAGTEVGSSLEMIGVCLRKRRLWDHAIAHFQQVLQSRRLEADAVLRVLFELGVTYEARGDKSSAYRVYQRLLAARPDYRDGEVRQRLEGLAMELGLTG